MAIDTSFDHETVTTLTPRKVCDIAISYLRKEKGAKRQPENASVLRRKCTEPNLSVRGGSTEQKSKQIASS